MKKLLALALALVLGALLVVPAFAEEVSESDISVTLPDAAGFQFERRDTEKYAAGTTDVVSIDGNNYTVDSSKFRYELNLDPDMGYICVTQDYAASLESYWVYTDSEGMWKTVIDNDIHLLMDSLYYSSIVYAKEIEGDLFSSKIGNLSDWNEDLLDVYLDLFMKSNGFSSGEIVQYGTTPWMHLEESYYLTIVNSEYVLVRWEGADAMTSDDAADVADLLAGLTISAH